MQNLAWTLSLILMAIVAAVFLWVAAGASRPGGDAGAIAREGFQWRDRLFFAAILVCITLSFATLWQWPIAGHADVAPKADVVIRATGNQYRWELDRDTVQVGYLVQFELTSADVNHGFAIYQSPHRLVAQTQAMPGYVNKLQVRFTQPGDYRVLCLEYCGIAHHNMRAVIKVRAGS
jgi:cytochrome c oxidase subunit 2